MLDAFYRQPTYFIFHKYKKQNRNTGSEHCWPDGFIIHDGSLLSPSLFGFCNISNLRIEAHFFCFVRRNLIRRFLILHESQSPHRTWKKRGFSSLLRCENGSCLHIMRRGRVQPGHPADTYLKSGLISLRFMMSSVASAHRCELDSRLCLPLSIVRTDSLMALTSIRAISCTTQVPRVSVCETFFFFIFIKSLKIFIISTPSQRKTCIPNVI